MIIRRTIVDVIVTPDYQVGYEQIGDCTMAHCVVRRWSPAVSRRFQADIQAAQCLLGRPVYVIDDPNNILLPKFLRLIGFKLHSRVTDIQGREVDLYERTLD